MHDPTIAHRHASRGCCRGVRASALIAGIIALLSTTCSSRDKGTDPGPAQPDALMPPTVGERLSSDDQANEQERAAREAEARVERLAALRAKLKNEPADELFARATKLADAQDFHDAAQAFTALLVHHPDHAQAANAAVQGMRSYFRSGLYGEGLTLAEDALTLIPDPIERARLQRVLGNGYLAIPHWGTERGGRFLRGQWGQGKQSHSFRVDRARALAHLEAARETLHGKLGAGVDLEERVGVQFDLVGALSRFTPFDAAWQHWWYAWAETADDDKVADEGADERAGEWYGGWWEQLNQYQPRGLEVTPDGRIVFVERPASYRVHDPTTAKIKFLLHEVVDLDQTNDKHFASQALLRQALLFRARDGVERLQRLGSFWWRGAMPYQKEVESRELHSLQDDEVLGLVATHLQVYRVPEDESFPGLMRALAERYPDTEAADQAGYLLGQFYQSRAQYDQARRAYRTHLERYAKGAHRGASEQALALLDRPELSIVDMGVQPAGRPARLSVKFRNLRAARFEVRKVDMDALTRDFKKQYRNGRKTKQWDNQIPQPNQLGWYLYGDQDGALKKYAGTKGPGFQHALTPDASGRYAEALVDTPLSEPGLYVIQAYDPGDNKELGKGLLLIEAMAQVVKQGKDGGLLWVTDAMTGAPIAGAKVETFEYWNDWQDDQIIYHSRVREHTSDAAGLARIGDDVRNHIITVRHGGRTSYTGFGYGWGRFSHTNIGSETTTLVVTDRPVYRPGDTVEIKVWAREKRNGSYQPAKDVQRIRVRVYDPQGNSLQNEQHKADEFGAVYLRQTLEPTAALGMYRMDVEVDGNWSRVGGNQFRVEEYKAPEFTVTVESAGQARLGDKVPVKVQASYLFGGAVADAKVRYRVYRQDHQQQYMVPGVWDWLYGPGYGRCMYIYDWLGWWHDVPATLWYPWWGPPPEPARDLVSEGEGRLDGDGVLAFDIDTTAAKRDFGERDHRYIVTAEVTDLSRRLIEGEGSVLVTRASYVAHVEIDRGFYSMGDEIGVHLATLKNDGELFAQSGELIVEEVRYQGENNATTSAARVDALPVNTRAEAPVRMTWRAPRTGLYKFTFAGRDERGSEVRSSALAWVTGPGFHGRSYRFKGIELYTDKRTYEVGDTAKLLINADHEGAYVLLSARAESGFLLEPRVVQLAGKSTVIDIPITDGDVPNFFLEALTVSQGELMSEVREVFVPPRAAALNVAISGVKDEYRPGESVELTVKTTGDSGEPVAADVALAVFDQAVLYIQPELTPVARAHFWGQRRSHNVHGTNNLEIVFGFGDQLVHPDRQASWNLGSTAQGFFQQETDWRSSDGKLAGLEMLASKDEDSKNQNSKIQDNQDSRNGHAMGGLMAKSEGRRDSVAREKSGEIGGQLASTPAAMPVGSSASDSSTTRGPEPDQRAQGSVNVPASAARVRRNFADTAHFAPRVRTGKSGVAKVRFTLPDNLTTWRVKAIGLDANTRVGQSEAELLSTKKLLLRLQAPRFFRERDRVVLSAIVHNKYNSPRKAKVSLRVDDALLAPEGPTTQNVAVPAHGEARVDFWVDVKGEGDASVRMDVVADGREHDSDAKEMRFPVLVHGLVKTVSKVDSMPMGTGADERTITLEIPADRRPEATTLHVRMSPSLAGGMLDALPYLLDYPYGCTEQTLSRFVPAVLTRKALQRSGGLTLAKLRRASNLNPQELTPGGRHNEQRSAHEHQRFDRQPVFDQALMDRMIAQGVQRIERMQNPDGGWGWWGRDGSSRYTTAHVLDGLLDAQSADVSVPPNTLARGKSALEQLVSASLYRYDEHEWVDNEDAYAAYVMSRYQAKNDQLLDYLFERRRKLSAYGKLLAALSFDNLGQRERALTLLRNAEQLVREDAENQTAWLETQTEGWWYWWNSDIESNALYLQALDQMARGDKARSARAGQVVKWLLNHRQNGYYWRSTRDSARVVAAFANHMQRSGEGAPDMDVEVLLDGEVVRAVHIDKSNLLTFDGAIRLEGSQLSTGRHTLTFRRKSGTGALYFNSYLSYFSTEEDVQGTGLEVKVERTYYKLVRDDRELDTVQGDRGQSVRARRVAYRKVELVSGARVTGGDLILVELSLESKNDYTFLAFEDPKPAGMEPVALRSGATYGEAVANMELRDDRVVFFLRRLDRGRLHLSYRLRAEIPGEFHAMPTHGFGMYAPELQTNSDEMRVTVEDTAQGAAEGAATGARP